MADDRAPIRIRGRGRALDPRGGRGPPKGGRNAVVLSLRLAPLSGSPIATHRSTLHDINSITDDTIDTSIQVRSSHHASHSITVRQRLVENVCGGLISHNSPTPKNNLFATFTPDSLAERRRNYPPASDIFTKLPLLDTNNLIYNPITPSALFLAQKSRRSSFNHMTNFCKKIFDLFTSKLS